VTASWKHKQQLQWQRLILSINKQSFLLEFAGAKSCRKWANSDENDWLLGATTGKCEEKDEELVCTLLARQTGSAMVTWMSRTGIQP